jgi:hypothetical protein
MLIGTSAPLMPRRSVMTRCSPAQSPFKLGSPFGKRSGRSAATAVAGFCR